MLSVNTNAAHYFVDRHMDEGRGDRLAYVEAETGRTLSYAQMAQGAGLNAGALAQAGIRPEERAAMLVLDQVEFPQIFWGR
ncbi:hypothetical protein [Sulfitobacter aestuariivivens]|uniref:hypothetical protein n=1 Tax=Sulfitobacter aestuariivivens TaxID=2766981 RepID=UPI003623013F